MNYCITAIMLWVLVIGALITKIEALPDGFVTKVGPSGVELVWSSNITGPVRVGGSRPEFRLPSRVVFGYPREIQGKLVLPLSIKQQELLATEDGQNMEVWSSGRRLDIVAPSNAAASSDAAVAAKATAVATPTVSINPAAKGRFNTTRLSYRRPMLNLSSTEFPFPLEVVGEVTLPRVLQATVKYPLVLFLHGRHATCYQGGPQGFDSISWPCPVGWLPIPSHKGYRYVADILASQGYVAVSISANGINGQDFAPPDAGAAARSILIRHHLNLWARWNTNGGDPWNSRFRGKLDMDKVVLVGHSRGGEGVNRAAIDATTSDPFKIVGLVSYGPTAFGRQVTPDVHSATILPTCDGDVSDLQGQAYVDASRDIAPSEALRSAVIALGCNHNYFNTEWTPGLAKAPSNDDWFDDSHPVCGKDGGSVRLTPQEQQAVGSTYTVALVRLAVKQEAPMLQLLDGSFVRPTSIGRADVAVHTVGGAANRLIYRPEGQGVVQLRNGMKGGECFGYNYSSRIAAQQICGEGELYTPHWLSPATYISTQSAPKAMELRWTGTGASARFNVPIGLTNLTTLDWVDVRVANDPNRGGARLNLLVIDKSGRNATLLTNLTTVNGWPGTDGLDRVHARTLRGSLASVRKKVDLNNIVAVLLLTKSAPGRVWVLDVAASQARIKQPAVLDLPVISVESLFLPEGVGRKTANVKITSNKPLTSPGVIWLQQNSSEGYQVDLAVGSSTVIAQFPFSWVGNKLYNPFPLLSEEVLAVGAVKGVVTGNYVGRVNVVEDDPFPTLSVVSTNVTAREGQSLTWQLRLSAPTTGIDFYCIFIPPNGTELTSSDVSRSWFEERFGSPPSPPQPLSNVGAYAQATFARGVQSARMIVPIVRDGMAENKESVACEMFDINQNIITLFGEVRKHG